VETAFRLFLDKGVAAVVEAPFQFACDAESDDTAADYQKICFRHCSHTIQDLSARSASAAT
jgi:hypothetical protein